MRKKGFTLVELLVVIAIIALLMGILMPALARVRQIAFRMVCGTNLSGIGKAMLIYANDYDDELPVSGNGETLWGATKCVKWDATSAYGADGAFTANNNRATITSCFYLLVKYAEVTPKSFICKGDTNATEFEVADRDLIELWDFGPDPLKRCSYAYHQPFDTSSTTNTYSLTTSSEPGLAVAADPNPWLTGEEGDRIWEDFIPEGQNATRDSIKAGNALTHQDEGQNVLYLDTHVEFENTSACGINEDNIYTYQATIEVIQKGARPTAGGVVPKTRQDSLIVNDGKTAGPKTRTCFLPNTPVWVDGTFIPISTVTAGQTASASGTAIVKKLQEHVGMYECRDIVLENGNCISVVELHNFMLESGLWISSQNLRSGMKLKTVNGSIAIESVTLREMPYVGKVYNVKTSNHQYMVGEDAVIVRDN
jgi:prepilin-type N-terminal cleavage/methylation domain-containing protein